MTDVTISRERFADAYPLVQALLVRHHKEIAQDQDGRMPLDVDTARYQALDEAGILCLFLVRLDGVVIGYWVGFLWPHLHYKSTMVAMTDVYYLMPEHRKAGIGRAMFVAIEDELRALGAKKAFVQSKVYSDHSPLFESLGWVLTEITHSKWIG